MSKKSKNELLLSTDTLSGYGLDLIFETAKDAQLDGIDLAIWKNFDSWNVDYDKKLSKKHDLPVKVIQTSASLNARELNLALDLCEATGADTITINAPRILDFKAYGFIVDHLEKYREQNPAIHFSLINPKDSNIFALPIPKYRFEEVRSVYSVYFCIVFIGQD